MFRTPHRVRRGANTAGHGIDTPWQILVAGSKRPAGEYVVVNDAPVAVAPQWLVDHIGLAADTLKSDKPAPTEADAATFQRVTAYLTNAAPIAVKGAGGDSTAYNVACRVKDFGADEETAFERMAEIWNPRCPPGFRLELLRQKVRNAYKYGKNEAGCADPRKEFTAIPVLPPGIRQLPENFDPRNIPIRDFILGKRLLRGAVSEIVGTGGVLKSMMGLCSAVAIITKREITGERVRVSGNVLCYDAEDPADEFDRRIAGICDEHDIAFAAVRAGLFYWSGHDRPLFIASKERDRITTNEAEVASLIAFIKANKIVAVFLAPLIGLHKGAAENDNADMEAIMGVLRRIAAEGNCAVGVAHHTVKGLAKERDGGAGNIDISRGAGSTNAAVRSGYTLTWVDAKTVQELQLPTNVIRLTAGKGNYSPRGQDSLWFEVRSVDVGNGAPTNGTEFINPNDPQPEPSDTVGVPVLFDMAAAERAARGAALAKQDSLVGLIARSMPSDRCALKTVLKDVMEHTGLKERAARDKVEEAIPAKGIATAVGDRTCTVHLVKKGDYQTAGLELIRKWTDD